MAVKLSIQEELPDLVNQEVAKAVQPLHARITKLHVQEMNTDLYLQLDELEQYGEDLSFESQEFRNFLRKTQQISS